MLKKFINGNIYVFTTKKFKKDQPSEDTKKYSWPAEINGNKVDEILRTCHGYYICPEWCKCIRQK